MNGGKTLDLSLKDVYQLLISTMRYAYTRNNHLAPGCDIDKCKAILPRMLEVDSDFALATARQLCDECISDQLSRNFSDGEDDEFGNRKEAIEFVEWLLEFVHTNGDLNYKPYNYSWYLENIAKDDEKRYNVYEILGDIKTLLTKEPISKNEYPDFIFNQVVDKDGKATYHHIRHNNSTVDGETGRYTKKRASFTFKIIEPVKREFLVEPIDL